MPNIYALLSMRGNATRRMPVILTALCLLVATIVLPGDGLRAGDSPATELVMLDQKGCPYCRAWDAEVGVLYARTPEGRRAPLRRVDIHTPWPADLAGISSDVYTPTFILVHEGREIGRIRGYPGEDFFWGLLGRMLQDLPQDANAPGAGPGQARDAAHAPSSTGLRAG